MPRGKGLRRQTPEQSIRQQDATEPPQTPHGLTTGTGTSGKVVSVTGRESRVRRAAIPAIIVSRSSPDTELLPSIAAAR